MEGAGWSLAVGEVKIGSRVAVLAVRRMERPSDDPESSRCDKGEGMENPSSSLPFENSVVYPRVGKFGGFLTAPKLSFAVRKSGRLFLPERAERVALRLPPA